MATSRSKLRLLPAILVFFACTCLAGVPSAFASTSEVIDLGHNKAIIYHPDGDPLGSAILVSGGTTKLEIAGDGSNLDRNSNFMVRTRRDYVDAGFVTALAENSDDLRPLIVRLRGIAQPVFVIGTSNGTIVTVANATRPGGGGPDAIVLTSTVTKSNQHFSRAAADYPLENLTIPVLIVHNTNDSCRVSPPSGVRSVVAKIKPELVTTISVTSSELVGDPCEPMSPHGYLGIEGQTVSQIIAWMKVHTSR
jgi:pimeloyl-ACP methyl ester carboxylesterase